MAIIQWDDIKENDILSFKTLNNMDLNEWTGKVIGKATYELAKKHADLLTYDRDVRASILGISLSLPPIEQLHYIFFQLKSNVNNVTKGIFAYEWVELGSLIKLNSEIDVTLKVYDIGTRTEELVNLLKDAHFVFKLES